MEFTEYFYSLVKQIPKGKVSTYGALARALGDIRASQAVGRMLNRNPYAPVVPCHRVVMSDGSLGGFFGGIEKKIALLKEEGVLVEDRRIAHFDEVFFSSFLSTRPLDSMRKKQIKLQKAISLRDSFDKINTVGAVDVAYNGEGFGACLVYDFNNMEVLESKTVRCPVDIPFISTYLAFRELPVIKKLMGSLEIKPDVLLVDGNGVLHPFKMGIASHVGVELDIPTIGIAKSLLCGEIKGTFRGPKDHLEIEYEEQLMGYALLSSPRSKKPIYISPGHGISFETSLDIVRKLCIYRLPEPLRMAHKVANEYKSKAQG